MTGQTPAGRAAAFLRPEQVADLRRHLDNVLTGRGAAAAAARATGVSETTVRAIRVGERAAVTVVTADALWPLTAGMVERHRRMRLVNACGSHRRIRAAQWMGWPLPDIAAELGRHRSLIADWLTQDKVSLATHNLIKRGLWRLHATVGPSAYLRAIAPGRGWHSVGVWDDIDDPACRPRRSARRPDRPVRVSSADLRHDLISHVLAGVERFGSLTAAEQVWLWRQHQRSRRSPNAFASRFRLSGDALHKVIAAAESADQPHQTSVALAA